MKATKLPSGNYRVRVEVGLKDGKRQWKSFTGRTKAEALRKAAVMERSDFASMTLQEACEQFVESRKAELSPSTIRGYQSTIDAYIKEDRIGKVKLEKISTPILQEWIGRMGLSAKSKKNHLGLVLTVLRFFEIDKIFRVRIAPEKPVELYTPTIEEVNKVIAVADPELEKAIALACFGLRRGEICALTGEDIDRKSCTVKVTKALAKSTTGEWILKMPKTRKSIRTVPITPAVVSLLPEEGRVVSVSPDVITLRFIDAVKNAGVPHFRFHDLRSFFASISMSSAVGSGAKTVQDIGGWETDRVLKSHYERSISDTKQKDTDAIILYFKDHLKVNSQ
jgi:integrase